MEHNEKHREMFNRMVKCQESQFWAENVLLKAIKNWIQTKYSYTPTVRLIKYNFVSIVFFNTDKVNEYDKIIENVCEEFKLEKRYCKYCCARRYEKDEIKYRKTIEYELFKGGGE